MELSCTTIKKTPFWHYSRAQFVFVFWRDFLKFRATGLDTERERIFILIGALHASGKRETKRKTSALKYRNKSVLLVVCTRGAYTMRCTYKKRQNILSCIFTLYALVTGNFLFGTFFFGFELCQQSFDTKSYKIDLRTSSSWMPWQYAYKYLSPSKSLESAHRSSPITKIGSKNQEAQNIKANSCRHVECPLASREDNNSSHSLKRLPNIRFTIKHT